MLPIVIVPEQTWGNASHQHYIPSAFHIPPESGGTPG